MEDFVPKTCGSCKKTFNSPEELLKQTNRFRFCAKGHLWINCSCHSTMMIKNAINSSWVSSGFFFKGDAKEFWSIIKNPEQIPMIDHDHMKTLSEIDEAKEDLEKIAKILEKNPLMASMVISSAHQIAMVKGNYVNSLNHALSFFGPTLAKNILYAKVGQQSLNIRYHNLIDLNFFWKQAKITAEIAMSLGDFYLVDDSFMSNLYLSAQLINIGKLIQAKIDTDKSLKIYQFLSEHPTHYVASEQMIGGVIPHETLGEIVASLWGLPDTIIELISKHHKESKLSEKPGDRIELYEIIAFSNQLMHWFLLEPERMNQSYFLRMQKRMKVNDSEIESLFEEVKKRMEKN